MANGRCQGDRERGRRVSVYGSHHASALSPVTGDASIAAAKHTAKDTISEIDSR